VFIRLSKRRLPSIQEFSSLKKIRLEEIDVSAREEHFELLFKQIQLPLPHGRGSDSRIPGGDEILHFVQDDSGEQVAA
jgi:hypothetical protein